MEFVLRRGLDFKSKQALILKDADGETVYCCSECPQRYTEKELMELHLCMHNKEYRFICNICGRGLKRKEHLERHMLEHQEVRPFVCLDCGKAFKRKEHLNIHKNIHSTHRDQCCNVCSKTFHRKDHLQKHMQIHNKGERDTDLVFVEVKTEADDDEGRESTAMDVNTLLKLQENVPALLDTGMKSEDPERPFACCICLKTFKRKDHLKLHNYSHMKKDKICSECGKAFHKQEQLLVHMNVHVRPGSLLESDPAPVWENVYDEPDSLLKPLTPSEAQRPHQCAVCFKRFKRRQHLKVHSHTHEKTKQASIWCSLCNEGFFSNSEFEAHACMSHADENEQNLLTNENDMSADAETPPEDEGHGFIDSSMMDVTVEESQEELSLSEQQLPIPIPVRVYVCKYCSKQFRRKDHYKIHLNIHTGIKTLFCPYCGKGFYRKDHMQKHIQVHEKKKKKKMPELLPMAAVAKAGVLPEITIHAPSNSKLRIPLKMKVPYQVVTSSESGEQKAVIVHPNS